jgi:hypothetical protein
MRKDKPTMAVDLRGINDLAFVGIDRTKQTRLTEDYVSLVGLGLCPNVPSPCGHCWYCKQRGKKLAIVRHPNVPLMCDVPEDQQP